MEEYHASCQECQKRSSCRNALLPLEDKDLVDIWHLWCMCRTQMRYSFGGVAGLDYVAVSIVAKACNYGDLTAWDFDALRLLEMDVLEEQAERQKTEEAKAKSNNTLGRTKRRK